MERYKQKIRRRSKQQQVIISVGRSASRPPHQLLLRPVIDQIVPMSIHLEGGSLFVHSKRPDKFWTVDGLPSKKLKELEGQWKADTQRAVEKTKSKCEKEAKVLVSKQQARDLVQANKRMEDALAAQKAM